MDTFNYSSCSGEVCGYAYAEEAGEAAAPLPSSLGSGGKNCLHDDLFPSLISCEGVFSGFCKQFGSGKLFGGQAPKPLA